MARNLPYVRVADTGTYPTQKTIQWIINKEQLKATGINYGNIPLFADDVLNRVTQALLFDIEQTYDLTSLRGTTAQRPTTNRHQYFDTTLGIPIWWNDTNWVNSVGGIV